MNNPISIRDIARAAGVSHTTVSRALRDSPLISLEVRHQLQQLAREMGYTPNAVAQSLKARQTHTIGLIVTTIADPFVGRVVRGIEAVAQDAGFGLLLSVSNNDPEQEIAAMEIFHRRRVDGLIIAAARLSAAQADRAARITIPTVLINPQAETPYEQFHTLAVNDYSGAQMATQYLLALGHHAIGYIGAGNRPGSNRARLAGYRDALRAAGIAPQEAWVRIAPADHRYHSDDVSDGQALLPDVLAAGVSAIFCYNDMLAMGVALACRERGIAIPEQLSIMGFDDIELAAYVTPALTTIHQPKLRLGQLAMEMLLRLLKNEPVENAVLPTELVARESTAQRTICGT